MYKVRTRILRKDVTVQIKKFCRWVDIAVLSSRRNKLEYKAACLVDELNTVLSEIQAAEKQLAAEVANAEKNESKDYGYGKVFEMSKDALNEWIGKTASERRFDRPDQGWKKFLNPSILNGFGMNPQNASQGSLKGKGADLLNKAGPSGTTVYTREGLSQHARHLAAGMGADEVIDFREENKKGGDTSGNSEKAIKKRIREANPFESSDYSHDRGAYEKFINREYQENKDNYLDGNKY